MADALDGGFGGVVTGGPSSVLAFAMTRSMTASSQQHRYLGKALGKLKRPSSIAFHHDHVGQRPRRALKLSRPFRISLPYWWLRGSLKISRVHRLLWLPLAVPLFVALFLDESRRVGRLV
jgi:hypothetical protein